MNMNYDHGVLTVTDSCDKVRISRGKNSLTHTMGAANELPLSFGDGSYIVELFQRLYGNHYKRTDKKIITAENTEDYLLSPNSYVPETAAWDFAKEMCAGMDEHQAYQAIKDWVRHNIVYDFVREATIPKTGVMPDPALCWKERQGICQDIASMTVGMLRAAGVKARLVVGRADEKVHAWTEAIINGRARIFDHPKNAKKYVSGVWY